MKSEIARHFFGDCVQQFRGRNHHPGKGPIALRILRLLSEAQHFVAFVKLDDSAAPGISHATHTYGGGGRTGSMKLHHFFEVESGQYIAIENPELLFLSYPVAVLA